MIDVIVLTVGVAVTRIVVVVTYCDLSAADSLMYIQAAELQSRRPCMSPATASDAQIEALPDCSPSRVVWIVDRILLYPLQTGVPSTRVIIVRSLQE